MTKGKITYEDVAGFKVMVIKNHPIMSPGVWNDYYYDNKHLSEAFEKTDWKNEANRYLFFDHDDNRASQWIGLVDNVKFDGTNVLGDLRISNEEAQKAIAMGAKFGISPKIYGRDEDGSVINFLFKNFSLVVDPACKTTFLNSAQTDKGKLTQLIPNQIFKLYAGEIMTDEKTLETPEVKTTETKAETPKVEAVKEPVAAEKITVTRSSTSDYDPELAIAEQEKMFSKLMGMGLVSPEFAEFMREYKKENPDADLRELSDVFMKLQEEKRIESLVEHKLKQREMGDKLSLKGDEVPQPITSADVDAGMLSFLTSVFNGDGIGAHTFNLSMEPKMGPLGYRTFELAATVGTKATTRGATTVTSYGLQPIAYMKAVVDAAKERMRFMQAAIQYTMPEGSKDFAFPKRKKYLATGSWETSGAEYAAGSELTWTSIDTMDSVMVTPTRYNYGVALANDAIRKNLINLVAYCRDELSYNYEMAIDSALRNAMLGTCTSGAPAEATPMTNAVNGTQTIFGGDATNAANNLDPGDVLTVEMLSKARRLLMSTRGYYWTGNVFTLSAVTKNPWEPTPGEPFLAFIAPEQEEALQTVGEQFTNAATYGSDEVVLNGEIGKYLGIKVISTTKTPSFSSGDNIQIQAASTAQDVAGHVCGLIKAGRAAGLVWGMRPEIKVFDWPNADQVRMKLSMDYGASEIHPDAIVRMIVADV
jgi:N4-gp56 family major capsid protein